MNKSDAESHVKAVQAAAENEVILACAGYRRDAFVVPRAGRGLKQPSGSLSWAIIELFWRLPRVQGF
jgi:hypothetical protein